MKVFLVSIASKGDDMGCVKALTNFVTKLTLSDQETGRLMQADQIHQNLSQNHLLLFTNLPVRRSNDDRVVAGAKL